MVDPLALASRGIGLDDEVATAVTSNSADLPVGTLQGPQQSYQIGTDGQIFSPKAIANSVVVYRDGAPVRVGDIAKVVSGVESPLQASWVGAERGHFGGNSLSVVFLVGAGGIVLGVLALLGIHAMELTPIAVIAFGTALVLSTNAVCICICLSMRL